MSHPDRNSTPSEVAAQKLVKKPQSILYESPAARYSLYACICEGCEVEDPADDLSEGDDEDEEEEEEEEDENVFSAQNEGANMGEIYHEKIILVECQRKLRVRLHCNVVTATLSNCPEIATLLVGPLKTHLTCHKALLGFYSEFFDAALYGRFREGESSIVELPEELPEEIVAFLAWIYSGTIESNLNVVNLWVLGDRLGSPLFCNDAMYLFMNTYGSTLSEGGQWLSAKTVDYVYSQTSENSALRCATRDVLRGEGPLCDRALAAHPNDDHYETEWSSLIFRGGAIVFDVATVSSFSNDNSIAKDGSGLYYPEAPYLWVNQHKYLMDTKTTRPIEDFIKGIKRRG